MTDEDGGLPLEWSGEPAEEIEVLTADFCDHFGGRAHCPGIATMKELGMNSEPVHIIFCTHWCHQVSAEV